jgi:serine/threonine protein kinase
MLEFDTERDPIDVVAEDFAQRCRQGEEPSVSLYVQQYPQLAEQLRTLLPPVAKMEQWKRQRLGRSNTAETASSLKKLGDYRILGEVGRGGMGIVYEAIQESLGRRVALKILPKHSLLDAKKLDRFHREAQAAARLHHTNIVPVFGVGEQDGMHYYVMQFIQGKGLNELLQDWRKEQGCSAHSTKLPDHNTDVVGAKPPAGNEEIQFCVRPEGTLIAALGPGHWPEVARIGIQAAQALHYAHHVGTLHRDVKPANLLIDEEGTVWITDFGLAKLADHPEITGTGEILGTVAYMAPECFHGQADARSDVYSLGLTLYEMITLQPPFAETNPANLIRQVSEPEIVRPRSLNPAIPRDLETIVLKAIAREPEHRYQSAGELADDLERFLNDRPILARRTNPLERVRRWCRRNKALASLTAVAAASFLLAAVVGWVGYVNTRNALDGESAKAEEARKAKEKADLAKDKADLAKEQADRVTELMEANVKLSLEHIEEMLFWITHKELGKEARKGSLGKIGHFKIGELPSHLKIGDWKLPTASAKVTEEEAAFLKSILSFYDAFAAQNTTNQRLQSEAVKAYQRVEEIHRRLKQGDKAAIAHDRVVDILENLVEEFPNDPNYRLQLAEAYAAPDSRTRTPEVLKETRSRLEKALTHAAKLASDFPTENRYTVLQENYQRRLAVLLLQMGYTKEATEGYQESVGLLDKLFQDSPDLKNIAELSATRLTLADLLLKQKQAAEARIVLEESIDDLQLFLSDDKKNPKNKELTRELGKTYRQPEVALKALGETALAAEAAKSAREIETAKSNNPRTDLLNKLLKLTKKKNRRN